MKAEVVEILTCPFCGNTPLIFQREGDTALSMICSNEYCRVGWVDYFATELEAITKWNKRFTKSTLHTFVI
jgi:uncharacterized protein YbaR (Trm112 family)